MGTMQQQVEMPVQALQALSVKIFKKKVHRIFTYLGYYQLGINGKELARYFGISRPSVLQAIKQDEKFAKEDDVKLLN